MKAERKVSKEEMKARIDTRMEIYQGTLEG
jgi:hypothetical protein